MTDCRFVPAVGFLLSVEFGVWRVEFWVLSVESGVRSKLCKWRSFIKSSPQDFLEIEVVGPLPPVLISRYAKNHSPDDFCLRHWIPDTGHWPLNTGCRSLATVYLLVSLCKKIEKTLYNFYFILYNKLSRIIYA